MYDENGVPIKGRSTHEPPAYAANASAPTSSNHASPANGDGEVVVQEAPRYESHVLSSRQEWGIGLCESCCSRCHLSWLFSHVCLFPCQAARIYDASCHDLDDSTNCGVACGLCLLSPLCVSSSITAACLRRYVLDKYNISNESTVASYLRGCCCPLCSQCQVQRQLEMNNRYPGVVCCGVSQSEIRARPPPQSPTMDSRHQSNHSPFDPSTARAQREQPSSTHSDRAFHTVSSRIEGDRVQ
jgi:hypothetical protein